MNRPSAAGALVLGSDYRGLGAVQSLGRRGVEVWVIQEERGVATVSRYAKRSLWWPAEGAAARVRFLLELAERHSLHGWVLFPTRDDIAALCARHWDELAEVYRMTTPPWHVVRFAHDKRLTNRVAAALGIPFPRTWCVDDDGPPPDDIFPAILKPAIKDRVNALTVDKAWPIDAASFHARFAEAAALMPTDEVMVQERIRGDGGSQLSFAALAVDGDAICSLVARRVRQFPMDFGRASTFVVTSVDPDVRELGTRLLRHLGYSGLVEVEFKRDPETGEPKLLDINPRLWGWHTLGRRAGMDFAALAWRLARGDVPPRREAPPGIGWMWPAGDIPVAAKEIGRGRLRPRTYIRSFRRPLDLATLTADDPVPGLMEVPLRAVSKLRTRRTSGNRLHRAELLPGSGRHDGDGSPLPGRDRADDVRVVSDPAVPSPRAKAERMA